MSPSIAALAPDPAVHLHPRDAGALAVSAGSSLYISNEHGAITLPVAIDDTLAPGTAYIVANLAGTASLAASASVDLSEASP